MTCPRSQSPGVTDRQWRPEWLLEQLYQIPSLACSDPPRPPTGGYWCWWVKLSSWGDLGGPADALCLLSVCPSASPLTSHGPALSAWVPSTSLCMAGPSWCPGPSSDAPITNPPRWAPRGTPAPLTCISGPHPLYVPPHSPKVGDELGYSLIIYSLSLPPDCARAGVVQIGSPCVP